MRTLVALDFDWTVIDADSDEVLIDLLPPAMHTIMTTPPYSIMDWPDRMDKVLAMLHQSGRTRSEIEAACHTMPLSPSMRRALQWAAQSPTVDLVIVSDANTVTIAECLKAHGLGEAIAQVVTNPARWTQDGRLRVDRYTDAHHCRRSILADAAGVATEPSCASNLCKGAVLRTLRANYDRVVYLGDGRNDYCAGCELTRHDVFMPRRGKTLEQIMAGPAAQHIHASVVYWSEHAEVFEVFQQLFPATAATLVEKTEETAAAMTVVEEAPLPTADSTKVPPVH